MDDTTDSRQMMDEERNRVLFNAGQARAYPYPIPSLGSSGRVKVWGTDKAADTADSVCQAGLCTGRRLSILQNYIGSVLVQ